ncbi:MAG TPA: cupin domain-containing protein [Geminicoccaceae bacterium]
MTSPDFDRLMQPVGAERFFADYEGRRPLHLEGDADKFKDVMSWSRLNDLLGQATIWSHQSLQLVLDREPVPAARYCTPAPGRDGGQVLRPDPARVKTLLSEGATMVANDIDHLSAGLTAFSKTLEAALGGKVQGNLYLSSKRRQGFAAHFDTHDVYAVHVEGTKTWKVYSGRATDPIAHPAFKTLGREHHEKAKGELMMEVRMKPGDLLYLPRGQYHDALADEGGAVHVAFGITRPIGLDVLTMLFERMVREPAFRANLPRPDGAAGRAALEERLGELARALARSLEDDRLLDEVQAFQAGFRYPRHAYDLPALIERGPAAFVVRADGIRLIEQNGRFGLMQVGSRTATEVPPEVGPMVRWVMQQKRFTPDDLAGAFPERPAVEREKLLVDLKTMRLLAPAL